MLCTSYSGDNSRITCKGVDDLGNENVKINWALQLILVAIWYSWVLMIFFQLARITWWWTLKGSCRYPFLLVKKGDNFELLCHNYKTVISHHKIDARSLVFFNTNWELTLNACSLRRKCRDLEEAGHLSITTIALTSCRFNSMPVPATKRTWVFFLKHLNSDNWLFGIVIYCYSSSYS